MKKRIIKKNNKPFACKVLSYALISAMLACTVSVAPMNTIVAGAEERPITIMLDGEEVHTKVAPKLMNGTTYLPLVDVANLTGSTVEWDNATKSAKVDQGAKRATFTQGKDVRIVNGRTLVAIRRVAESLGLQIGWNQKLYRISIETRVQSQPAPKSSKPQAGLQGLKAGDYLVVQNHLGTFTCPSPLKMVEGTLCIDNNDFKILTGLTPGDYERDGGYVGLRKSVSNNKSYLHWEDQTLVCTANDPYGLIEKRLSEARTRRGNPSLTYSEYITILKEGQTRIDQENAIKNKMLKWEPTSGIKYSFTKDEVHGNLWFSYTDEKNAIKELNAFRKYMGLNELKYNPEYSKYLHKELASRIGSNTDISAIHNHTDMEVKASRKGEVMDLDFARSSDDRSPLPVGYAVSGFETSSKHMTILTGSFKEVGASIVHDGNGRVHITFLLGENY